MKIKNEYIKFLFLYLITILLLLFIEYILLKTLDFNEENLILIFGFIFLLALLFGSFLGKFFYFNILERNRKLDILLKETLHELNIPVATILANIELLRKKEIDEKRLKRLNRVKRAAKELLNLYKSLDYHIKREIQKVNYEVFNLKDLVLERINLIDDIKKDIKIEKDLEDTFVKSDKNGFSKAIDNLLSNAIKYNKKDGFIKLFLKKGYLIIEDSGIGIDESELIKIFERFYQVDSFQEGYGIGLSIVKSFCDENKINISIESKKEKGTKISLNLKNILI